MTTRFFVEIWTAKRGPGPIVVVDRRPAGSYAAAKAEAERIAREHFGGVPSKSCFALGLAPTLTNDFGEKVVVCAVGYLASADKPAGVFIL